MADRKKIIQEAKSQKWFNSLVFDEFEAIGREGPKFKYPNMSLYSAIDLLNTVDVTNMRCAEIGPGSGLIAIGLKQRGASYVAAIDGRHAARQCELAIELSGQDVDYLPIGIEGALDNPEWLHSFDLVFSAGLMYHLINPFMLCDVAKRLLKENGVFLLQSMITGRNEGAILKINTRMNVNGDWTTFTVPTPEAMRSMLSLALFERIAECHVKQAPTFHSVIARSINDANHLKGLSGFESTVFEKYSKNPNYPYGGYSFSDYCKRHEISEIQLAIDNEKGIKIKEIDLDTMDAPSYPFMPRPRAD
jgi:2-polyprenyl-3-methyl-5-hydroxy-6-metoxy-1,4-benzoquinol methylase